MSSLTIQLPPDLEKRLMSRAKEAGYDSVEQYAQALLRASTEEQAVDEDLEQLLLSRLSDSSGDIEFNQQFKDQFRREIQQRRSRGA